MDAQFMWIGCDRRRIATRILRRTCIGTQNNAFTGVVTGNLGVNTRNDDISQDVDVVTARVDYRFGGPVAAKY
jgi:hypothetical protein